MDPTGPIFTQRGSAHVDGSGACALGSPRMECGEPGAVLSQEKLIYAITIPLSVSIILTNLVIIFGIVCTRQLHNTPNYFFLSLLVADLCTGVALPFISLMGLNRQLSFGSCLVAHILPNFLFLAFLLNLVMVHYERYVCIAQPLHYSNLWMHRSFPLALLLVWMPPLLYASLPAFGWNNWSGPDRNSCCARDPKFPLSSNCSANVTPCCSYRRVFTNAFIYLEVYGLVLPAILTIGAMTCRVLWITRGQLKDICRLHRSVERGQASDQEQRLNMRYTRCLVAVSLTFLACWLPYLIYMHVCMAYLISDTKWNSNTLIVLSCMGIGSMTVVPLVLGLANRQYTRPAYKLQRKLRDRWRQKIQTAGREDANDNATE
ncbi:G-protein coupled bile acid receptor 1-like [Syngnathus scovelli]|uniref:G-protein coupled bile acid receptor 1-like n=1 Tax=Syngnathus scovelli TaxID=161590 RepID=UPI00211055B1|nr:G-protein coupled bile acid receptor 1-like [Syngnathus scovelli]